MLKHRYCAVQGKEVFICFVEVCEVILVEKLKELSPLFMQRIRPRAVCAQARRLDSKARRCLRRVRRLRTRTLHRCDTLL